MRQFLQKARVVIPGYIWILGVIIVVGIVVRTYHFEAWLRFSPDQARDFALIEGIIERGNPLPLLGPQAGNTPFSLGPIFYYFQYFSAMIFGVSPQAMAYPDLFFSILTLPLFFFFLRRYFIQKDALFLTGILSISWFFVEHARFASNVNAIPFFLLMFLFGGGVLAEKSPKCSWWAYVCIGIGLGVGIQQHTLLLLALPVIAIALGMWLLWQKRLQWLGVLGVILIVGVCNIPQIRSEWQTGGMNTQALVSGILSHSQGESSANTLDNIGLIAACQIQANAHFISSIVAVETCGGMFKVSHEFRENRSAPHEFLLNARFILVLVLSSLFSLGGYWLWYRAWRREGEPSRKQFLGLLALCQVVMFIVFIPAAEEVSVRYFNVLFFVPFLLLGFWLAFIREHAGGMALMIERSIMIVLIGIHVGVLGMTAQRFSNGLGSDVDNSVLGELYPMVTYMETVSGKDQKTIFFTGKKMYRKRFFKPLEALIRQNGGQMVLLEDDDARALPPGTRVFHIAKTSDEPRGLDERVEGDVVETYQVFQNITLFVLRK